MSLWLRAINTVARRLQRRDILAEDGQLYLSRYRLFGWMPGDTRLWPCSLYLHRFHQPDLDDAEHNHPWRWAVSLILAGGYAECRLETKGQTTNGVEHWRVYSPGDVNVIRSDTFHRITSIAAPETWTLFLVGPRVSSWGFLVRQPVGGYVHKFVPWRERLAQRGIPT